MGNRKRASKSFLVGFRNGIRFTNIIMGDYKGRVNLRLRKKRAAKERRMKARFGPKRPIAPLPIAEA